MYERIKQALIKTDYEYLLGLNDEFLDNLRRKHNDDISLLYKLLEEQKISENEFNQYIVNLSKNIDIIAEVLSELDKESQKSDQNVWLVLEHLDTVKKIYEKIKESEDQLACKIKEAKEKSKQAIEELESKKHLYSEEIYLAELRKAIDLEIPREVPLLSLRWNIILEHSVMLTKVLNILSREGKLDIKHTLCAACNIEALSPMFQFIQENSVFKDNVEKYIQLICLNVNSGGIVTILYSLLNERLFTPQNLDKLFKHAENIPNLDFCITLDLYRNNIDPTMIESCVILDQSIFDVLMDNVQYADKICEGISALNHAYELTPTSKCYDKYWSSSDYFSRLNDEQSILLVKNGIEKKKKEIQVEFKKDLQVIFQCPEYAREIGLLFEWLKSVNPAIILNDNQRKTIIECQKYAGNLLNAAIGLEQKNKLTQVTFNAICKIPQLAEYIADQYGANYKTTDQHKDLNNVRMSARIMGQMKEHWGFTYPGQALPGTSLPHNVAQNIAQQIGDGRIDENTSCNVASRYVSDHKEDLEKTYKVKDFDETKPVAIKRL